MLFRTFLFIALVMALSAGGSPQTVSNRKIPCKTHKSEASCYWVKGCLEAYNGAPAIRLWKIGTHRLLAIFSGQDAEKRDQLDNEHPELPPNIQRAFKPFQNRVFADFEVCPLEPERPGTMQAACIESAKNIVVEK